jgi:hypothetical protein
MAADDVMPTQAGHGEAAQHLSHDGRRQAKEKLRSICRTMDAGRCSMVQQAAAPWCPWLNAVSEAHWATDSRRTGGLRPKSSGSIADLHLSRSS